MEEKSEFELESRPYQKEVQVKPADAYLAKYRGFYDLIYNEFETSTDPLPVRLARFNLELDNIKNQFRSEREAEYQSKSIDLPVSHSCTKGSRGGTKDCGWKYVSPNHPSLYTTPDWLKMTSGRAKRTAVFSGGASAGIKQTKSGKGRIAGTLTATFRYRPEFVIEYTDEDVDELFAMIGARPIFDKFLDDNGLEYKPKKYESANMVYTGQMFHRT